jgi:FkbM family methyltransferase
MRDLFKRIVFRIFNKLFHTAIHEGNLNEIKLISNSGLRLGPGDIDRIRTLVPYEISPEDLQFFLVFHENCKKKSLMFTGNSTESHQFFTNLLALMESNKSKGVDHYLMDNRYYYFSQEGEDIILSRVFEGKSEGFYVDIGAHHPTRFSNTHFFYQLGWRGINIEPYEEVRGKFDQLRSGDINLTLAVSNSQGLADFYVFKESALNTFDESLSKEYQNLGYEISDVRKVETRKLSDILKQYMKDAKELNFMSIDVENHELEVLQSNDWNKYRPNIILVEILNFDMHDPVKSPVHRFLSDQGYAICAKTLNTVFYRDTGQSGNSA